MDWKLFASTATVIFLAELPDKTALAVLLMASRYNPVSVFAGVCGAFAVQSALSVFFGSLLAFLPKNVVQVGSGVLFLLFAVVTWFKKEEEPENEKDLLQSGQFVKVMLSSFITIFIAEWGDLTQLATATLQARYRSPATIFSAATLALWTSTGLLVLIGHSSKKYLNAQLIQKGGALAFAVVGVWILLKV